MAYVAGKPLYTSPDASAGFFHFQSQIAVSGDSALGALAEPLRCTKQVCGGSNRNGTLFAGHARVGGEAAVLGTMARLRARPRSAMARAWRQELHDRVNAVEVLPAPRYKCARELSFPSPAPTFRLLRLMPALLCPGWRGGSRR